MSVRKWYLAYVQGGTEQTDTFQIWKGQELRTLAKCNEGLSIHSKGQSKAKYSKVNSP